MTVSVALVGCGWLANNSHGPALAAYVQRYRDTHLAACCDHDMARAAAFKARFGFEQAYAGLDRMLAEARPDAVVLVVPDTVMCDLACQVLDARIPLLLEKPPGRTVAEIDRMIAAAERAGVRVEVAFNRRHMPLVRTARSMQAEITAGGVFNIDYEMTRFGRKDPDFSLTAIHGIDLVSHVAGSEYRELNMRYQPVETMGPGVANIYMEGTTASGVPVSLRFLPVTGAVTERMTVHGKDSSLYLQMPVGNGLDGAGRLTVVREREVVANVAGSEIASEAWEAGGFYSEDERFLEQVRAGLGGCEDLKGARQVVAVTEAVRKRRGRFNAS